MNRIFFVISCLAIIGMSMGVVFAGQSDEELCIPLGTITLSAPQGIEARRSPVEFPHAVHFDYNCRECHHQWAGNAENMSCMALECHDSVEPPSKADKSSSYQYYKTAYHGQCVGCHRELKDANKRLEMSKKNIQGKLPKTGPTGCVECHPKQ